VPTEDPATVILPETEPVAGVLSLHPDKMATNNAPKEKKSRKRIEDK
jgi:hypothetical protein